MIPKRTVPAAAFHAIGIPVAMHDDEALPFVSILRGVLKIIELPQSADSSG